MSKITTFHSFVNFFGVPAQLRREMTKLTKIATFSWTSPLSDCLFPIILNKTQFLQDKSSSHGGLSEMHVLTSFALF